MMNYIFAIQPAKLSVTHLSNNVMTNKRYPCLSQDRCFTLEAIAQVFKLVYLKLYAGKNAFLQDHITEMVTVCQNWTYNHHKKSVNYYTVA